MTHRGFNLKWCIPVVSVFVIFGIFVFHSNHLFSQNIRPSKKFSKLYVVPPNITKSHVGVRRLEPGFPYLERELFYHNTLNLDYLHPEDFLKEPPPDSQLSSPTEILKAKIIRAERSYQKNILASNKSAPAFQCPFSNKAVGLVGHIANYIYNNENNAICGFELYKTEPKPQECVIYKFGASSNNNFEKLWLSATDCTVFKFQYSESVNQAVAATVHKKSIGRTRTLPQPYLQSMDLRKILKQNGHGWLDVLSLDIGDQVYSVLESIIKDFSMGVLPFAQLLVKFPNNQGKINDAVTLLENQRLRAFHVNEGFRDIQYSFFNLRGRHLLLVGEE